MGKASLSGRRFGPFELNPSTGELRKNGIRIKFPNQAFQLLSLLTDRAGELVTREEIRVALWPNETVVEWEHSINTAMKRIRAALGDSTSKPVYVETLRGRGYRFVGLVEACELPPSAIAPQLQRRNRPPAPMLVDQAIAGREVSHYRVLEMIGKGGMGIVYKAEDLRLGRQVALKFLPLERVADPVALARLEREARTASILNHPNICTIYDVELKISGAFIAMELLEGGTLSERLDGTKTPFSTSELLDFAIKVANALEAAHERNIIHRDIKPANIFLTKGGEPKVLDFGLSKPAPRWLSNSGLTAGASKRGASLCSAGEDLTASGATPGTTAYMSPEQTRGEELDARTDLYSFGALLYEVATGRQAFRNYSSLLPPTDAARHPQKLWEILARLLEPDRELRYQTAGDVASELRRLKRDISAVSGSRPTAEVEDVPPLPENKLFRWIVLASLAAVSALALTLLGWRVFGPARPPAALPLPEILTSDTGNQIAGDFSPDGKRVVYCWNGFDESNYDLYALTIRGGGPPQRLTSDIDAEYSPAWSPDGKSIAFLKGPAAGVAALMLMSASGGPARKLCDTSMSVAPFYRRIEWSPDSRWIVMEGEPSADQDYALAAVSVSNGERHKLTFPEPSQGDLQPAFAPDGQTLAFVKDVGNGVSRLFLLPVSAEMAPRGAPRPLRFPGFEKFNITSPRWISGRELIFTSNRGGSGRLWRAPVDGASEPVILSSMGENISFPAVSRDGKRLLFSRNWVDANIWLVPADPLAVNPPRLLAATPTDSIPDFSLDGAEIAFNSERSGSTEIWLADRNGASPRQLTHYGGPVTGSARWSPDGKWIAYDSRAEGQPDIYVIPSAGGTAQRLTKDPAADIMPFWSPNGRWIYFCSGRSGVRQVWRIPPQGGLAEQITKTGGCAPHITPDGNTIYYMKQSGPIASVWMAPADGGEEMLVLNNVLDRCLALSRDRLYYVAQSSDQAHPSLRYMDLRTHKVDTVRIIPGHVSPSITVSPDGTSVLYRQVDRQGSNLMLVDTFH
jgi:Tol biopolymer transport system component/serine/threonine protein kinase